MKISTKTRYGLRALIYVAEETANDEEKLVRIKEISENQKLSVLQFSDQYWPESIRLNTVWFVIHSVQ